MDQRVRPLSEGNSPFEDEQKHVKKHHSMFSEAVDQNFLTALIHAGLELQSIEKKYDTVKQSNIHLSQERQELTVKNETINQMLRRLNEQLATLRHKQETLEKINATQTNDLEAFRKRETHLERLLQQLKAKNITLQLKNNSLETKNKTLDAIVHQCEKRKAVLGSVSTLKTNRKTGVGHYFDLAKEKLKNQTKLEYQKERARERAALEVYERKQARQLAFDGSESTSGTPLLVKARRIRNPLNEDEANKKILRDKYRHVKKTKGIRNWKDVHL